MVSLKILTRLIWSIILTNNKIKIQLFKLWILRMKKINHIKWMWILAIKKILNPLKLLNLKKQMTVVLPMKNPLLFGVCIISLSCSWDFVWISFLGILQFWDYITFQKEGLLYFVETIKINLLMEVFSFQLQIEMPDFL